MHTGRAVQYAVVVVVAEYSRCIGEPVRYLYSLFKQWPSRRSVVLVNLRQVVIQSSDIDTACSSRRARVPPLVWLSSKRVHQRLAWLLWLVAPHKTITSIRRLISRFGSSLRRHFVHWRGFEKGLLPDKLLCTHSLRAWLALGSTVLRHTPSLIHKVRCAGPSVKCLCRWLCCCRRGPVIHVMLLRVLTTWCSPSQSGR